MGSPGPCQEVWNPDHGLRALPALRSGDFGCSRCGLQGHLSTAVPVKVPAHTALARSRLRPLKSGRRKRDAGEGCVLVDKKRFEPPKAPKTPKRLRISESFRCLRSLRWLKNTRSETGQPPRASPEAHGAMSGGLDSLRTCPRGFSSEKGDILKLAPHVPKTA